MGFISQNIQMEHIMRTQWDLSLFRIGGHFRIAKPKSEKKAAIVPILVWKLFSVQRFRRPKDRSWALHKKSVVGQGVLVIQLCPWQKAIGHKLCFGREAGPQGQL